MSDPRRKSPLAHRKPVTAGQMAALKELPNLGKLAIRIDAAKHGGAVSAVLGFELPGRANSFAGAGDHTAIWLGPDEWMIITLAGGEHELAAKLAGKLQSLHHQVVDVTDYYTTIALSGTRSREMLMKLSTIDFHPRALTSGTAVTTMLAKANATVLLIESDTGGTGTGTGTSSVLDNAIFEIIVRRSMADYLWCLLCEAGHEFGLTQTAPIGRVQTHLPHFD